MCGINAVFYYSTTFFQGVIYGKKMKEIVEGIVGKGVGRNEGSSGGIGGGIVGRKWRKE